MMQDHQSVPVIRILAAAILTLAFAGSALAQPSPFGKPLTGPGGGGAEKLKVVEASGKILPPQGNEPAQLQVTATIAPDWHIYSITQPPGGPIRTRIKVAPSPDYQVGEFHAISRPTQH